MTSYTKYTLSTAGCLAYRTLISDVSMQSLQSVLIPVVRGWLRLIIDSCCVWTYIVFNVRLWFLQERSVHFGSRHLPTRLRGHHIHNPRQKSFDKIIAENHQQEKSILWSNYWKVSLADIVSVHFVDFIPPDFSLPGEVIDTSTRSLLENQPVFVNCQAGSSWIFESVP